MSKEHKIANCLSRSLLRTSATARKISWSLGKPLTFATSATYSKSLQHFESSTAFAKGSATFATIWRFCNIYSILKALQHLQHFSKSLKRFQHFKGLQHLQYFECTATFVTCIRSLKYLQHFEGSATLSKDTWGLWYEVVCKILVKFWENIWP